MNITDFLTFDVLNEANVYNIKLPMNGVSIENYLKQHLSDITDSTIANQLFKKLSIILINRETNLLPVRRLPPNAPDWAKQAFQSGELMAFIPTDDLNEIISNIAHYVQAAINDTKSTDNNIVVRAKQELNAISKVPDINTLYQKSNQYFAKKVKKETAANTEGMEEVADYNGWIWYKLITPDAFRREGKVLQNCIGKIWTQEKTEREGMTIYILRTNSNDSVVAVRSDGNLIQEIKGKNNQPPVERYMPYVFNFVKDSDLDLSTPSAKNELRNAGYWVFNDKIIVPTDKAVEIYFDEDTQKLRKIEPDKTIQILDETFKVYTNPSIVDHITEMTARFSGKNSIIYKGTINGTLVIFFVGDNHQLKSPFGADYKAVHSPEQKIELTKYIIELLKKEHLQPNFDVQYAYRLSSTPPYTALSELGKGLGKVQGFDKIDVSKVNGKDIWLARALFFKGCTGPRITAYVSAFSFIERAKKGIDYNRTKIMYRSYTAENTLDYCIFVDNKNTIFDMVFFNANESSKIQNIRNLMEAEHLTIEKSASPTPKIVIVPPSTIMSREEVISQRMEKKKTATTKPLIEFEDGASFKLLEGNELIDWLHQAAANITTDAVYMLMIDDKPVVAVPIHKKKISGMFTKDTRPNTWRDRDLERRGLVAQLTTKTLDFTYGPYIKAFAKKMGFTIESKNLLLKPDSKIANILTFVVRHPGQIRSKAFKAAHVGAQSIPGLEAPYNMLDRPLRQLGLITAGPGQRKGTTALFPTEKGGKVAIKLYQGEDVPLFDLVTKEAPIKGGSEPEVPPEPDVVQNPEKELREPGRTSPGKSREGSKAQRIYDLFVRQTEENNGTMPRRGDFIRLIMQPPYNMTPAGAGTYYYNMKTKYLQQHGRLGESFTFKEWLMAIM